MSVYKNKFGLWVRKNTLDEFICKEQQQYLKRFKLKETDRFLDVGANIGATAFFLQGFVADVYCFEPDKDNFKMLYRNTKQFHNVHKFNKALVGNVDLERDFYLNKQTNKGTHSFLVKRGRDKITVECRNIQQIIKKYKINIVKMDVEGAECELLTNMSYKNIDELIFEYHFTILKKDKYFELIKLLKKKFIYVDYKKDPKKCWTTLVYCSNRD